MNSRNLPQTKVAKVKVRIPKINSGVTKIGDHYEYEHQLESTSSAIEKIIVDLIYHGLNNADFGSHIYANVEVQEKSFNHLKTLKIIITKDSRCDKPKNEMSFERVSSATSFPIQGTNFYLRFNPIR